MARAKRAGLQLRDIAAVAIRIQKLDLFPFKCTFNKRRCRQPPDFGSVLAGGDKIKVVAKNYWLFLNCFSKSSVVIKFRPQYLKLCSEHRIVFQLRIR